MSQAKLQLKIFCYVNDGEIKSISKLHDGNRQCPFLDQEIKELMDERDQVHRVARRSGAVTDWEQYRWCRNEVKRRLCDAERIKRR